MIDFLINLSIVFSFLPLVPLALWMSLGKRSYRDKTLYFCLILEQIVLQSLGLIFSFYSISNHLLLNIDSLVIHLLLGLFYLDRGKMLFLITFILNLTISIVFTSQNGFFVVNNWSYLITSLFGMVISWNSMIQIFYEMEIPSLWKDVRFNLNVAFIFYFSCTAISSIFENYLLQFAVEYILVHFILQLSASLLLNIFLTRSLWFHRIKLS